ncbi:hypothetical protein P4492_17750, partial [Bacillus thuringiensis]|nr:hypothetical protein [Bacillus thuringiensis]
SRFILNITALFIEKILSVVFFRNAGGTPYLANKYLYVFCHKYLHFEFENRVTFIKGYRNIIII